MSFHFLVHGGNYCSTGAENGPIFCVKEDYKLSYKLKIQVFWDVTLSCWVSSSRSFERSLWPHLHTPFDAENESTTVFRNVVNYPLTQRSIPEGLKIQQHCSKDLDFLFAQIIQNEMLSMFAQLFRVVKHLQDAGTFLIDLPLKCWS
jgi:hypothetical protein